MKRNIWVLALIVLLLTISACSNDGNDGPETLNNTKSPAPDADEFVDNVALEAIVDLNSDLLKKSTTEKAWEEALRYYSGNFSGIDIDYDKESQNFLETDRFYNDYKKIKESDDYFLGAYYGLYREDKENGEILYLVQFDSYSDNNFAYQEKKEQLQYRFSVTKEDEEWKINNINGWSSNGKEYAKHICEGTGEAIILHDWKDEKRCLTES